MDAPRAASRQWADLPAGVLSEIARHLHDAADFTRFHAVCVPWRESAPPPPPPRLLPWLIKPCGGLFSSGLDFHRPFSTDKKRSRLYQPHFPALRNKRFDCSDAATGRLLAAGVWDDDREASLVDPLTGDATALPPLPGKVARGPEWSRGTVSSNGAVLFDVAMGLAAAVLRPGETRWKEVDVARPLGLGRLDALRLFTGDAHSLRAAALCSSGVLAGGACAMAKLPLEREGERYVLESSSSQGELLCVDVLDMEPPSLRQTAAGAPDAAAPVSVHALELDDDGRPRWVKRGRCGGAGAGQVCLFLGWESSFAVDAREFSGGAEVAAGACAYFVGRHPKWTEGKEVYGVYRHSFEDGTTTVVDELPEFFDRKSMWYTPKPRISPVLSRRGR